MTTAHIHPAPKDYSKAFAIGIALNLGFVAIEALYATRANSMALFADAGHNLSDVLGLLVAWAGAAMARKSSTARFTYGFKKASILAALINALFLLVAVGAIIAEAVRRLAEPAPTQGKVVAAVVVSGLAMLLTGQLWIDPVMSLIVAVVILWGSFGLLKESVWMSLAGVPSEISLDEVELELGRIEGVAEVHDLHVWPLSTTETALTAHVVAPSVESTDELLTRIRTMVHDRFGIEHATIQVERENQRDASC